MIIKPISALLIVTFGQINFLSQNHESSREKIKEFHQKKFEKSHDLKEEKDAKKIVTKTSNKQLSARIKNVKGLNLKKVLSFEDNQKEFPTAFAEINPIVKFMNLAATIRAESAWFGCCRAS
jgi:hypothetical protein